MANDYDDLIKAEDPGSGSIAAGVNEYAEIMNQEKDQVKANLTVTATINPDERAKALDLSKKVGLPAPVVERNFDHVQKKYEASRYNADQMFQRTPGLSRFLMNPDHAAIARDEIDTLSKIEDRVQEHGLVSKIAMGAAGGVNKLLAGISKSPAYLYDIAAQIGKSTDPNYEGLMGIKIPERAPESWRENAATKFFEQNAQFYNLPDADVKVANELMSGNWKKAGHALAYQAFETAPMALGLMAAAMSGYGAIALTGAGVVSGAEKASELQKQNVDAETAAINASIHGGIEIATEAIPLGFLKHWSGSIAKKFGKQASFEVVKDMAKTMVAAMGIEGSEEAIASFAQDVNDWATGVTTDLDFGSSFNKALNAFTVGAASGGLMTGPATITSGVARATEQRTAKMYSEFYTEIGEQLEQTKIKDRSVDAKGEFVKEIVAGTDVEKIYVSPQKFVEYFQKKNIPPVDAANDLGVGNQLDTAIETGADLEINMSEWSKKLSGTEHYNAFANDVKFSPNALSVNEAKESEKEISDTAKEAETAVSETEKNYAASAKTVKETVKKQLIDTGMPSRDAEAQATLYESAFKSLGTRSGQDPLELFNKYGLTINGRRQDGTVLNQAVESPDTPEFKNWFGDSKIVDESGKPKTVYHGSPNKFEVFDYSKIGELGRSEGQGFYFTNKKGIAEAYNRDGGQLVEAYLSIKKPMPYDQKSFSKSEIKKILKKIADLEVTSSDSGITDLADTFLSNYGDIRTDGFNAVLDSAAKLLSNETTALDQLGSLVGSGVSSELVNKAVYDVTGFDGVVSKGYSGKGGTKATGDFDVYVAFFPEQIKSVNNRGTFDPNNKNILFQPVTPPNQLGFYSKLEQTITQKMGNSQPVPALKAMLKDIKPEEMKWSGLDEFLKGKEKVSKDEVLNFIRANQLDVKEVVNSESEVKDSDGNTLTGDNLDKVHVLFSIDGDEIGVYNTIQRAESAQEEYNNETGDEAGISSYNLDTYLEDISEGGEGGEGTKFSKYTLPGGENYREVLLTMPNEKSADFPKEYTAARVKLEKALVDSGRYSTAEAKKIANADALRSMRVQGQNFFSESAPAGARAAAEEIYNIAERERKSKESTTATTFTSSHFDEKNILAHVRLNDRIDIDGKKVLFVEEIQSDWHQAGRKKGYKTGIPKGLKVKEITENGRFFEIVDENDQFVTNVIDDGSFRKLQVNAENALKIAEERISKKIPIGFQRESVPDAPFKKTEAWAGFALKRVIRMAAEGGYERVAWTTGEQQAERYDLSKQVDEIKARKNDDGTYMVRVIKDGEPLFNNVGLSEAELEETVGKDLATKIIADSPSSMKSYKDVDLKVGGEGMKGFYDNILVKSAEKLVKKFGGKVGETSWNTGELRDMALGDDLNTTRWPGGRVLKVHSIDITPELKQSAINEGFTLFQENRGKISFGTDRKFNIELLKDANLSTFLHETGHFYLEVFGDLAEADGANQQIKDDFATLLDWFGVSSRADIKVEHHEQFARGFEAYLMDGKAPSSKLRKIFAKFKVWLTSIYKSIRDLDVQLSPEVRSVMDRLVAAEDEVKQAEAELDTPAMFADPKAAGMSDAKAAQYIEAREEARLFAEEKIISQLMETVKRERTREYKDRRNQVKDEVTGQVDQMNVVKAQAMLQRGKMPDGSALPDGVLPIKLDKQSLVEMYGAEFVKRLPRPYIYARDGGVHPDAAASILQFESGDALVQALVNTPPRAELIEQMVNQRMDQIYPDMLTDGSLPQESIDAVINEKRAQINRLELEWLQSYEPGVTKDLTRKIAQRKLPTNEQIKEQARRIIGSRAVGDIKPYLYLRAHVKYHNEAVKLFTKGDIDAAFEAKKKSVINEAIYNQALLANEDIKKSKQFFKRLNKKDEDVAKSRDVDLVNAARAILSQFGLDKTDKTADEYLQKMADYDPERYQSVKAIVDQATRRAGPYRTVMYDDFVAMKDAVESLWSLAKSEKEIEIDGKKIDIEIAKDELIAKTIETSSKKPKAEYDKVADKNDKFKIDLLGARASLTRVETWSDVMDVTHGGPFRRYIWQPVSDATLKYRQERVTVLKKYEQLLRGYEKNLTKEIIRSDELKFIFANKTQLMMAVLHSGNDSNLHKLLVGRGWGSINPDGTLDRSRWDKFIARMQKDGVLTKADYDFAQQVWDLLESLKPETQKAHKLMYGYYFNEITANEVVTPFGSYRGGYLPAKVDVIKNEDAAIRREREEFEKTNNSFTFPTTGRGATKSRVESYAAPLSLDMNLLGSHIDWALRFTYIEPRVKEVSRLVLDKRFRKALGEIDQTVAKDALIPWLQRAAQQQVVLPSNDGLSRALNGIAGFLRANAATQIMFGNITNTLQQTTGLVVAMTKVKPKYVRNALVRYLQSPKKNTSAIHEKSAWMKDNQDNSIYDLSNSINEVLLNPTTFEKFKDFSRKHTYFLQSHAQNIVNSVVWQAAYDQSIERKMTDKEAVRFADSVVRTTQGTNRPEDISRFETGTKTELLFKQFVGYFNMLANLNAGELMKISRQVGLKKGAGRGFYIYMMGLAVPAILADAIVIAMAGKGLDQDDDDEYLDDILKSFFGSQFKTITATIPYVGQFMTAAYNKAFTPSKADDRVSLSPAISVLEGAYGAPAELYKRIADDANNEKKLTKDALTLIGVMTGLPTGPVGKPVGYLMDVQSGKAEPTGPVDFTRGLVTGRSGQ